MANSKTKLLSILFAGACVLSSVLFSCNDEKKTSTETTVDTMTAPIDTLNRMAPDSNNMNRMDTGETKPIVPGT
jgi:hypothetical protein